MPPIIERTLIELESRYGRKAALAVALATVALAVVPIPGIALLPGGIAELITRLKA